MLIYLLFCSFLLMGTTVAVSSTSWISCWIGLELNLLAFIPLMLQNPNQMTNEATLKYFLTQTFASIFLLFSIILASLLELSSSAFSFDVMASLALMLKMGAAPLHFWFPAIMQGLSWYNCLILMTWQKIAPLFLLISSTSPTVPLFALASAMVGAVGGINQLLLRKILAYSSINHLGWMITATMMSEKITLTYFIVYTILNLLIITMALKWNINHLSQSPNYDKLKIINLLLITNLLSLGGIPPFLGFLPKWLIISQMLMTMPLQITIITMTSIISLYFYLRVAYTLMMKSPSPNPMMHTPSLKLMSLLTVMSTSSLLLVSPMM